MHQTKKRKNGSVTLLLGLLGGTLLAASAWASGKWVIDTRISAHKMVEMAEVARKGSAFPIMVNDDVLRELNHYLGTQKGREFVARAEANLDQLRPMLNRQLAQHSIPEEVLAVGLVESGFANLPQSANPGAHGAGVWQFIPNTARIFGLKVDEKLDERLDTEKETYAAIRYLDANHLRFDNWLLGVMAYNMGERALDNAILKSGTRDPWKLVQQGFENDQGYLAKFMAAVLILKNRQTAI